MSCAGPPSPCPSQSPGAHPPSLFPQQSISSRAQTPLVLVVSAAWDALGPQLAIVSE